MDKIFGANKKKNLLFGLAFALVWAGLILWNFAVPEQAFSQAENRYLAGFPRYTTQRLLEGDFMEDMNTYLTDQFVGRPYWVGAQSLLEYSLGKREISEVYIGKNALYRHYPPENAAVSDANLAGVNAFFTEADIPTAVMLVPSSTYLYRDKLPWTATAWDEGAYIDAVYAGLAEGVTAVDVREVLAGEHPTPVYYRTDHHWTSYGAYLGYRELAGAMGLPLLDDRLEITPLSDGFLGTNHSRTVFPLVTPETMERYEIGKAARYETGGDVRDSIYFPEFLEQKDKYAYFLGQLPTDARITTGAASGRKLVVFKDSYVHCLIPLLLDHFSEIHLADPQRFSADQAAGYDAALFLYSTATFSQQLGPGGFRF